jgi:hypothetical protein
MHWALKKCNRKTKMVLYGTDLLERTKNMNYKRKLHINKSFNPSCMLLCTSVIKLASKITFSWPN